MSMSDKADDERQKNRGRLLKLVEGMPAAKFVHPMDVTSDEQIDGLEEGEGQLGMRFLWPPIGTRALLEARDDLRLLNSLTISQRRLLEGLQLGGGLNDLVQQGGAVTVLVQTQSRPEGGKSPAGRWDSDRRARSTGPVDPL